MTASFVVEVPNVTVNFAYTAEIVRVVETVNMCVKKLYQDYMSGGVDAGQVYIDPATQEVVPFEQLTDQQKLDVLDIFILKMILTNAKTQHTQEAMAEAIAAATITIEAEMAALYL